MASVKEMRTRIGSVKSTQKITKALQMVAAAKLRRAQEQVDDVLSHDSLVREAQARADMLIREAEARGDRMLADAEMPGKARRAEAAPESVATPGEGSQAG